MSDVFRPSKPRSIGQPLAPADAPETPALMPMPAVRSISSTPFVAPETAQQQPLPGTSLTPAANPAPPTALSPVGGAPSPARVMPGLVNPSGPKSQPLRNYDTGADKLAGGYFAREAKAAETARRDSLAQAEAAQKAEVDQANYQTGIKAARENRETIVNPTTGKKEFVFSDEEIAAKKAAESAEDQAKAQQAKRNDNLMKRFKAQNREYFTDSEGNIKPVQGRKAFEAEQAVKQQKEGREAFLTQARNEYDTETQLYNIDREARPIAEKPEELATAAGRAVEDAVYTAIADKSLDKATRARLEALANQAMASGKPLSRELLSDDLAEAVAKVAPDQWSNAEAQADSLRIDAENREWRAQREQEIAKLKLKSVNPEKWQARYGSKAATGTPTDLTGGDQAPAMPGKQGSTTPAGNLVELAPLPEREADYQQRAGNLAERARQLNATQEAVYAQWDGIITENNALIENGVTVDDLVPIQIGDEQRMVHKTLAPRLEQIARKLTVRGVVYDEQYAGIEVEAAELRAEAANLEKDREREALVKQADFSKYLDNLDREPDLRPVAAIYRDAESDYEARRAAIEEDYTFTPEQRQIAQLALLEDRKATYTAAEEALAQVNVQRRKKADGHARLIEAADNADEISGALLLENTTPEQQQSIYARQRDIVARIANESGISVTEAARAVRSYQESKWTWLPGENTRPLSNGGLAVNPALVWDDSAYNAAVFESGASEKAKEQAILRQDELKNAMAPQLIAGLRKLGGFERWEMRQLDLPRNERPRTEAELIGKYYAERGGARAFADNAAMIAKQGGNDIAAQVFGLGGAIGLHPWLPTGWREQSRAVIEDLGNPEGTFNAANAQMSEALNAANVPQLVQDVGRAAVSTVPALVSGGVGAASRAVTTGILVSGSRLGTVGRIALGSMGRSGFTRISAGQAVTMAKQAGLGGAGAGAFMQTFGATYPDAIRAYQDSGMSFEEASNAALLPSAGSGVFTAAITMAFGKTGVEGLLRGRGAWEVTAGEVAEFLAKPGNYRNFRATIRGKKFNELVGTLATGVGKHVMGEATEEGLDAFHTALVRLGTYEPDDTRTVADAMGEGMHGALIGAFLGGGMSAARMTAQDGRRLFRKVVNKWGSSSSTPLSASPRQQSPMMPQFRPQADPRAIVEDVISKAEAAGLAGVSSTTPPQPIAIPRNENLFPGTTNFGGKFEEELQLSFYEEINGIGVATYENPKNGSKDVFITAFDSDDYIAYIRIYDSQGNPTNRFTSKLERQTPRAGATRQMMESIQSLLPETHQYTEDTSVSTDGLQFIRSQLNQGYSPIFNDRGEIVTSRVAINGASKINEFGKEFVDETNRFGEIKASTLEQFEKAATILTPLLNSFHQQLGRQNVHWENGKVFVDLPVLEKTKAHSLPPQTPVTTATPVQQETRALPEQVALSDSEIDNFQSADGSNAQVRKNQATSLRKIAMGQIETMSGTELATVGLKRNDKGAIVPRPLSKLEQEYAAAPLTGMQGENVVISAEGLDMLAQDFPRTRALVKMDEAQARAYFREQEAAAKAKPGKEQTQATPGTDPIADELEAAGFPVDEPIIPPTPADRTPGRSMADDDLDAEEARVQALTDHGVNELGFDRSYARAQATRHVRKNGVTDPDPLVQALRDFEPELRKQGKLQGGAGKAAPATSQAQQTPPTQAPVKDAPTTEKSPPPPSKETTSETPGVESATPTPAQAPRTATPTPAPQTAVEKLIAGFAKQSRRFSGLGNIPFIAQDPNAPDNGMAIWADLEAGTIVYNPARIEEWYGDRPNAAAELEQTVAHEFWHHATVQALMKKHGSLRKASAAMAKVWTSFSKAHPDLAAEVAQAYGSVDFDANPDVAGWELARMVMEYRHGGTTTELVTNPERKAMARAFERYFAQRGGFPLFPALRSLLETLIDFINGLPRVTRELKELADAAAAIVADGAVLFDPGKTQPAPGDVWENLVNRKRFDIVEVTDDGQVFGKAVGAAKGTRKTSIGRVENFALVYRHVQKLRAPQRTRSSKVGTDLDSPETPLLNFLRENKIRSKAFYNGQRLGIENRKKRGLPLTEKQQKARAMLAYYNDLPSPDSYPSGVRPYYASIFSIDGEEITTVVNSAFERGLIDDAYASTLAAEIDSQLKSLERSIIPIPANTPKWERRELEAEREMTRAGFGDWFQMVEQQVVDDWEASAMEGYDKNDQPTGKTGNGTDLAKLERRRGRDFSVGDNLVVDKEELTVSRIDDDGTVYVSNGIQPSRFYENIITLEPDSVIYVSRHTNANGGKARVNAEVGAGNPNTEQDAERLTALERKFAAGTLTQPELRELETLRDEFGQGSMLQDDMFGDPADPSRERQATLDRMKIRAIQNRRLLADDLVTQEDIFNDTRSEEDGQGLLFAGQPAFYSKLSRVITEKIPNAATPQQILATIDPARGSGVKEEEIKWSGIRPALDRLAGENGGKVSKSALLDYLENEGAVQFKEVVAADKTQPSIDVQYSRYQLPGGTNYKEVVLSMPLRKADPILTMSRGEMSSWYEKEAGYNPIEDDPSISTEDLRDLVRELAIRFEDPMVNEYTSNHFPSVPNYVAHLRTNERADSDGRPGLFIEEIQSDRHQAGRNQGYAKDTTKWTATFVSLPGDPGFKHWKITDAQGDHVANIVANSKEGALAKAAAGISDAPFRKDWPLQLFKRALRDAVAGGKDWIGWTVGETQNDRFDLSKQVDSVSVTEWPAAGQGMVILTATKDGSEVIKETIPESKIEDYVGKDVARKLMDQPAEMGSRELSGAGLKVGGTGMKGFYDNILPKEIGKYVKQWGAQVEQSRIDAGLKRDEDIDTMESRPERVEPSVYGFSLVLGNGDKWGAWSKIEDAERGLKLWQDRYDSRQGTPIWRVNITPSMRSGVESGQPLFAARPRNPNEQFFDFGVTGDLGERNQTAFDFSPAPVILPAEPSIAPQVDTASITPSDLPTDPGDLFAQPRRREISATGPTGTGDDLTLDTTTPASTERNIDDFGEKLGGARKDLWSEFRDRITATLPDDVREITMGKHWPEPDYGRLISAGANDLDVAAMKALRDLVPRKPGTSWKLRRWGEMVKALRDAMQRYVGGTTDISDERFVEIVQGYPAINQKIALYQFLGYPRLLAAKDYEIRIETYTIYKGVRVPGGVRVTIPIHKGRYLYDLASTNDIEGDAFSEVARAISDKIDAEAAATAARPEEPAKKKPIAFGLYRNNQTGELYVGKKVGREVVRVKADGWKNQTEAFRYMKDHQDELEAIWNGMKATPQERLPQNLEREGIETRNGNVTAQQFTDAFGFRGVEFGNWVEDTRRQSDLNQAYDALIDLSRVLEMPTQALSLDGSLGLAFGSRGKGGKNSAAAHYEPDYVTINLTKNAGPGSLAHEWFHAVDNYFARLNRTGSTANRIEVDFASQAAGPAPANVRPEVWSAFYAVRQALNSSTYSSRSREFDKTRSKPYYAQVLEMAARAFEKYVKERLRSRHDTRNDYLVNIADEGADTVYPTAREFDGGIRQAMDQLFETMDSKPGERGTMLFAAKPSSATKAKTRAALAIPMNAVNVLHGTSTAFPKPEKKTTNDRVASNIEEGAVNHWGRKITSADITPEEFDLIAEMGAQEFVAAFNASGKSASDWYSLSVEIAMEVAGVIHPELTNDAAARRIPAFAKAAHPAQAADLVMRMAMAITSQNLSVELNTRFAEEQFQAFKATGRFDTTRIYGEKATSIAGNLALANLLIDRVGFDAAREFVLDEYVVRDLQTAASKILRRKIKVTGNLDDTVNGAALFGPKIGQGFLQNLMGRFDPVTIDLWMRRTWGRWTGDVVGEGATGERLARMLDAARADGMDIGSLKSIRVVDRTRKNGNPYRTVSGAIEENLETDFTFVDQVVEIAGRLHSLGQDQYRLSRQPINQQVLDDLESGKITRNQFIRQQQRRKNQLNAAFLARKDKTESKPDFTERWRKERGYTAIHPDPGLLKPDWAKAAAVIVNSLKPIDVPSPQDRRVIVDLVNEIRQRVEALGYVTTNADVQAILWYPEKDLWAKLRGEEESNLKSSYDEQFLKIAKARGLGAEAAKVAARITDQRRRATRDRGNDPARTARGVSGGTQSIAGRESRGEAQRGRVKLGAGRPGSKAIPIVSASRDVRGLRAAKDGWTAAGYSTDDAEEIISKFYHRAAYAQIPQNAALIPQPSTSGRNLLPHLLAMQIASHKSDGLYVADPMALPVAEREAKYKTTFWAKMADPVSYSPLPGIEAARAAAKEGRPVWIVEDLHNTGESWVAFRNMLEGEGIPVAGVTALVSADDRMTSQRDMERIAGKITERTNKPLEETRAAVDFLLDGSFKQLANKAEVAIGSTRGAFRFLDLATNRGQQRRDGSERAQVAGAARQNEGQGSQQGAQGDVNYTAEGQGLLFAGRPRNPNEQFFDFGASGTTGNKNEIDLDFSAAGDQTTTNGVKPTRKSSAPDGGDDIMRWAATQAENNPGAAPLPAGESSAVTGDRAANRRVEREAIAALIRISAKGVTTEADRQAFQAGFKDSRRVSNIIPELVDGSTTWDIVGAQVTTAEEFFALNATLRNPYFESVRVAILDDDSLVVHAEVLNIGTINESIVDLARVARLMAIAKAKGVSKPQVVMSHNHPGGDPSPSSHDRQLQARLESLVASLGGTVLDHVITNGRRGYSLRRDSEFTMPEESQVPWVHFDRTEMPRVTGPESVHAIAKSLRAMNPLASYLVLMSNRLQIIGIEQIPDGSVTDMAAAVVMSATAVGANRVMLMSPNSVSSVKRLAAPIINLASIELIDVLSIDAVGDIQSAREMGLLEDSGEYITSGPARKSVAELNDVAPTEREVFTHRIKVAKEEIRRDIANGTVSPSVADFSDLHDYVDANEYINDAYRPDRLIGPLGRANGWKWREFTEFSARLIDELDEWIKAKGHLKSDTANSRPLPLDTLPEKPRAFIESLLTGATVTEAAKAADYDTTNPDALATSIGKRLAAKLQRDGFTPEQARATIEEEVERRSQGTGHRKQKPGIRPVNPNLPSVQTQDGRTFSGPGEFILFAPLPLAYHGTPHKVDKFTTEKIGTGEGAQVYGYGLYFAQDEKVARYYRDALTQKVGSELRWKWNQQYRFSEVDEVLREDNGWNTKAELIALLRSKAESKEDEWGESQPENDYQMAADLIESGGIEIVERDPGNLYTVRLKPDDSELLDWDKPWSKQSEKVRSALSGLMPSLEKAQEIEAENERLAQAYLDNPTDDNEYAFSTHNRSREKGFANIVLAEQNPNLYGKWANGSDIYSAVNPGVGGLNTRSVSEFLLSLGIRGIRYLDGNSRADGTGTYNYVVFDEADIEIIAENGQPVAPGLVLGAANPAATLATEIPINQMHRLMQRIDAMYSTGRTDGVEGLEAELEILLERAETDLDGMDENDDADNVAEMGESDMAEMDSANPSPEEELINAWHAWNGGGPSYFSEIVRRDHPTFGAFVRSRTGDNAYVIQPGITDEQIEEAAKESAANYERRRAAMLRTRVNEITLAAARPQTSTSRPPRAPGETLLDAALNRTTRAIAETDTVQALKARLADGYAAPFVKPVRAAVDFILKQAIPLQRLPEEVNALMKEMAIKQAFAQQKAMDVIRSVSGNPKFSDLAWPAQYANDKEMRKRLFLAMQGKVAMESLPAEVQAIGEQLRARLNKAALEAVRQGRMHPDTYRGMEQTYMPHYYYDTEKAAAGSLFARMKLGLGDIMAQRTTMWHIEDMETRDPFTGQDGALIAWDEKGKKVRFRNKEHRDAFYLEFMKERAVAEIKARGKVQAFSAATKAQINSLTPADLNRPDKLTDELRGYAKRVEQDLKVRYRKGDPLTEEEQEKAGLIYDPVYSIAKHIAGMEHDNATAEVFNAISTMPQFIGDEGVAGYTKLPDNRRLGRLAGKYVRDDIAEEITALVRTPSDMAALYDGLLALWKTGKTVYNPGTHVRNVLGNLIFAQMAGANPITNPKAYREAIRTLNKGGAALEELYQQGVLGGDFLTAELRQDLAEMLPEMMADPDDTTWFKIAATVDKIAHRTGAKGAKRLVEAAYQMEDEVFKVAAYQTAKAKGMTPEEAAVHVRKWFPYYDQIGSSSTIRALRRTAMPFFSFQREAIRILGNAAKERPASLAFALAAPAALSAISAQLILGLDDEDYEEIKRTAMRGKGKFFGRETPMFSILMPTRSSEGRLQQLDLTNVMPFASLLGSRMEIDRGTPAWQQWALEMITGSPLTGIPLEMAFNTDTFRNQPIWEANMTDSEKRGAAAKYVWSSLMPPLVPGGTSWNMVAQAGTRQSNKSLERRNAAQSWLRAVVGIDVRNASPNLYAMAEQFRSEQGLDQPDFAGYGTTPESRARARVFAELVQDKPNLDTLARELAFLKEQGRPIETEQDLNRLLFYRNPIMVIDGEDNQRRFRNTLSPEARDVLSEAEREFNRIKTTSGSILRRASVLARKKISIQ